MVSAEQLAEREQLKEEYLAHMEEKNRGAAPGSWNEVPPIVSGKPFTNCPFPSLHAAPARSELSIALNLADSLGFLDEILDLRDQNVTALFATQLKIAMAAGDSRTFLPEDDPPWKRWRVADPEEKAPGHELNTMVFDAVNTLVKSESLTAFNNVVMRLGDAVFDAIPDGVDKGKVEVEPILLYPIQDLGLQSRPFKGESASHKIRRYKIQDWDMRQEIEAAGKRLERGEFGKPTPLEAAYDPMTATERMDFRVIRNTWVQFRKPYEREYRDANGQGYFGAITPTQYLIVCGINRNKIFQKMGRKVAKAVGGIYKEAPVKSESRIEKKTMIGGDYACKYDEDPNGEGCMLDGEEEKRPECAAVLDPCRGSVLCKSHAMMENAYVQALSTFGSAYRCKDRRNDAQHDILLVFLLDGLYVELQLHYENVHAVKILMHAVFEIQRLNVSESVALQKTILTGIDNVIAGTGSYATKGGYKKSASNVQVIVGI